MSSPNIIQADKLWRLLGRPDSPKLIDVRTAADFASDPRLVPTAIRRDFAKVAEWGHEFAGCSVVAYCQSGLKIGQGVSAWLRHMGIAAESLEGGFEGWRTTGLPLVPVSNFPEPGSTSQSVWVTRSRPKIDRIACPWLIRRFVDSGAVFLFVNASEVQGVADRFGATPFDVDGVHWSHRGELCTFDVMVAEFGLSCPPLDHLARIVRGADTARPELEPEAAGLLAVSLGLSRMYSDDLAQLEAGMLLYDAMYRWCRDAQNETHTWPSTKTPA